MPVVDNFAQLFGAVAPAESLVVEGTVYGYLGGDMLGALDAVILADGELPDVLVIGADYMAANSNALEWTVVAPMGAVLAASTTQLGIAHATKGSLVVEGTISDAGGGQWTLSFDLAASATAAALEPGEYSLSLQVTDQDGHKIAIPITVGRRCEKVEFVANHAG